MTDPDPQEFPASSIDSEAWVRKCRYPDCHVIVGVASFPNLSRPYCSQHNTATKRSGRRAQC